jgi:hypothetical protein
MREKRLKAAEIREKQTSLNFVGKECSVNRLNA